MCCIMQNVSDLPASNSDKVRCQIVNTYLEEINIFARAGGS